MVKFIYKYNYTHYYNISIYGFNTIFCLMNPGFFATIIVLSFPFWQQKGGDDVLFILEFTISVMASIVAYYICKWLDRNK